MTGCEPIRDLFGAILENEATDHQVEAVRAHLEACTDCSELFDAMQLVVDAGEIIRTLEPPPHLGDDLAASPCRRWLGLLYQAVDREISQANLERLLTHLESCSACRQVWHDLTLIHQVGDAMSPPGHLLRMCIDVRNAVARMPILGRRTATAAAYILALVSSLAVGNPTIIAQDFQAVAAERVSMAASSVSEVAADGRGEIRVLLWRVMRWGENRIETVRGWVDRLNDSDDDATSSDTASGALDGPTPQGESQ
jgi:predicted anti-sigma-YlaC factor YlaD